MWNKLQTRLRSTLTTWLKLDPKVEAPRLSLQTVTIQPHWNPEFYEKHAIQQVADGFANINALDVEVGAVWMSPKIYQMLTREVTPCLVHSKPMLWGVPVTLMQEIGPVVFIFPKLT